MRSRRGWTLLLQNRRRASWSANTNTIDSSALIYLVAAGSSSSSSSSSSLSHRHHQNHHHLRKVGRSRHYASKVSEERKRARNIGISAFFALSFILSALVFVVVCSFLSDRYRFLDILSLFLLRKRRESWRPSRVRDTMTLRLCLPFLLFPITRATCTSSLSLHVHVRIFI